jgi:hypothetical protein
VQIGINNDELFADLPLSDQALVDFKAAVIAYVELELGLSTAIINLDVDVSPVLLLDLGDLLIAASGHFWGLVIKAPGSG